MCYTYDLQNQLTSATYYDGGGDGDDHITKTYAYTYDTAGNLLTESVDGTVTKTYTYGNDQWNDLLTEYNGGKIAYEGQTYSERPELVNSEPVVTGTPVSGNPISYYNGSRWTLEWEHGRNLTRSLFVSSNTPLISENKVDVENDLTYTYDADGIRTGRTYTVRIYRYAKNGDDGSVVASVGEAETNATYSRYLVSSSTTQYKYITQNGKVVRETIIKGGVTRVLDYIYDESGRPSSLIYTNGSQSPVTYYYVLNLQGDVEKIIDADGEIQAQYAYDLWGKILSITDSDGASVNDTHIAKLNGLRYRGYHGDNETQWYCLQSRYYDPFTRRFVNADSYTSTGTGFIGTNMFAYCNNNPVAYRDDSGEAIRPTTTIDPGRGDAYEVFIDDQDDDNIASMPFGLSNMDNSGCGPISICNALIGMEQRASLPLISAYITLTGQYNAFGLVGMMPTHVASVMTQLGYEVYMSSDEDVILKLSKQADSCILWYAYTKDSAPYIGAHFTFYETYGDKFRFHNVNTDTGTNLHSNPYEYGLHDDRFATVAIFIFK